MLSVGSRTLDWALFSHPTARWRTPTVKINKRITDCDHCRDRSNTGRGPDPLWRIREMHSTRSDMGHPWPLHSEEFAYKAGDQESGVRSLGREDPLERGMATHSSLPAWKIPWTEEPGGPPSMELQRVGHDWTRSTKEWHFSWDEKTLGGTPSRRESLPPPPAPGRACAKTRSPERAWCVEGTKRLLGWSIMYPRSYTRWVAEAAG